MILSFGEYTIDVERRELMRAKVPVHVEPQVFDLLVYLVDNCERVVSKDDLIASVWHGRIVSDSTLTSRINAARKAVGDSGDEQRIIRTLARKGFRFVGTVVESQDAAAGSTSAPIPPPPPSLRQEIHFCTAADGVRIAYAEVGSGPPVVKAANWLNHLEYDWQSPIWSHLLREIAADHRVISY